MLVIEPRPLRSSPPDDVEGREFAAQLLERHALHDHAARACHRSEEQSFAAEDRGLDAAHELDVVLHGFVEGDDAARVHLELFARAKSELHEIAAAVDEDRSGSGEPLEDEAFTAEEPGAELLDKRDVELHRGLREQEAVALHEHGLSRREVERLNAARIVRGETHLTIAIRAEVGHEQGLTG